MAIGALLSGIGAIVSGVSSLAGIGVQAYSLKNQAKDNAAQNALAKESLQMEKDRAALSQAENEAGLQGSISSASKAQKSAIASIPSLTSDSLPMERD